MKKLIKQQQDRVLAELCQKIVAKKWSEKLVASAPEEVKAYEGDTNKELKELHDIYLGDLKDIKTNERCIEADVFAYRVLDECEGIIKELL